MFLKLKDFQQVTVCCHRVVSTTLYHYNTILPCILHPCLTSPLIEHVKDSQFLELSHDLEIDKAIMFLKLKDFQQVTVCCHRVVSTTLYHYNTILPCILHPCLTSPLIEHVKDSQFLELSHDLEIDKAIMFLKLKDFQQVTVCCHRVVSTTLYHYHTILPCILHPCLTSPLIEHVKDSQFLELSHDLEIDKAIMFLKLKDFQQVTVCCHRVVSTTLYHYHTILPCILHPCLTSPLIEHVKDSQFLELSHDLEIDKAIVFLKLKDFQQVTVCCHRVVSTTLYHYHTILPCILHPCLTSPLIEHVKDSQFLELSHDLEIDKAIMFLKLKDFQQVTVCCHRVVSTTLYHYHTILPCILHPCLTSPLIEHVKDSQFLELSHDLEIDKAIMFLKLKDFQQVTVCCHRVVSTTLYHYHTILPCILHPCLTSPLIEHVKDSQFLELSHDLEIDKAIMFLKLKDFQQVTVCCHRIVSTTLYHYHTILPCILHPCLTSPLIDHVKDSQFLELSHDLEIDKAIMFLKLKDFQQVTVCCHRVVSTTLYHYHTILPCILHPSLTSPLIEHVKDSQFLELSHDLEIDKAIMFLKLKDFQQVTVCCHRVVSTTLYHYNTILPCILHPCLTSPLIEHVKDSQFLELSHDLEIDKTIMFLKLKNFQQVTVCCHRVVSTTLYHYHTILPCILHPCLTSPLIEHVKDSQFLELSHDLEIDKAIMFLKLKDFQQVTVCCHRVVSTTLYHYHTILPCILHPSLTSPLIEHVKDSQFLELSHDLEIDKAIMFLKLKDFQQVTVCCHRVVSTSLYHYHTILPCILHPCLTSPLIDN